MYRLYSNGAVLGDRDRFDALTELTMFLHSDISLIKEHLLSGNPYPIRSDESHATLRAYERKFLEIGLDVFIEKYVEDDWDVQLS